MNHCVPPCDTFVFKGGTQSERCTFIPSESVGKGQISGPNDRNAILQYERTIHNGDYVYG